jgi:hypothetical protein
MHWLSHDDNNSIMITVTINTDVYRWYMVYDMDALVITLTYFPSDSIPLVASAIALP